MRSSHFFIFQENCPHQGIEMKKSWQILSFSDSTISHQIDPNRHFRFLPQSTCNNCPKMHRVKSNGGKCAHHGRNCFLEPRTYEIEVKTATPVKVY